jgi:hypothetical protein
MLLQVREGDVVGMHGFHFYDRPHRSSNAAIEAIRTTGGMEVRGPSFLIAIPFQSQRQS